MNADRIRESSVSVRFGFFVRLLVILLPETFSQRVGATTVTSQVCAAVAAADSGGQSFGQIIAGKTYSYSATGCASVNGAGTAFCHPDGNEYADSVCNVF